MKRDFTLRPNRMVHRFGDYQTKGQGSTHSPLQTLFPGDKSSTFELPLPEGVKGGVLGGGRSRSITAADGEGGAWRGWMDPASQVCKPNGKGYKK